MNSQRLSAAVVLGCTLSLSSALSAAENSVAAVETDRIEEVVVTARSLLGLAGRGASVDVVDAEELLRIRPTHAAEALSRLPGLWITRGSGHEHLTAIRSATLTGAGSCGSFLLLEDGVPIRPTGFCNVNNLFEMNIEQAGAVEVWRGPGSAVLGGNALKGAVNVMSRLPETTRIGVEGGSYGYGQTRVETRVDLSDWAAGLVANASRSDGYQSQTGFEQYKLNGVLEGMIGNWDVRATVSGTQLHQETAGFVIGTDAYKDGRLRKSNPNPEAYRDAWSGRAAVTFSNGGFSVTPYARRSQMNFIQHFLVGKPLEDNDQSSYGVLLAHHFDGGALDLRTGIQVEGFNGGLKEFQPGAAVGSAFIVATRPRGIHYDYDVDGASAALYYDLDYAFGDHWHLLHSGRVERLEFDYDNRSLDGNTRDNGVPCGFGGCLYTRPADRRDTFTDAAGRLGISRDLASGQSLYAVIATGFRPPQAVELYRLQSGQRIADLDSERTVSGEVGWRTEWFELTAFVERTRNVILRDSSGFNLSNGRTRSEGLEAALHFTSGAHQLDAALTFARHRYDFDRTLGGGEVINKGDDVDTAPHFLGYLRWGYRFSESLYHEVDMNWMDEYFSNANNTRVYDGHVVFNWRGDWQATPSLRLFVRVVNLFDKEYADRADFAFGNDRYFIAMLRQVYAGVDYTFD